MQQLPTNPAPVHTQLHTYTLAPSRTHTFTNAIAAHAPLQAAAAAAAASSTPAPIPTPLPTPPSKKTGIVLQNVQAVVNMGCALNLQQISTQLKDAEYKPRDFSGLIIRFKTPSPRATAVIFKSGKVVVTGTKRDEESKDFAKKVALVLRKLGFEQANADKWECLNMTAAVDLHAQVRLEEMHLQHVRRCTYEPETYPGLVYKAKEGGMSAIVFASGKITITGAKSKDDIMRFGRETVTVVKDFTV